MIRHRSILARVASRSWSAMAQDVHHARHRSTASIFIYSGAALASGASLPLPSAHRFSTQAETSHDAADLPTRHSRKMPPPICQDAAELQMYTDQLLNAPAGSLFPYDNAVHALEDSAMEQVSEAAWTAADEAIQLAEYVLRGHSSYIPNSIAAEIVLKNADGGAAPEKSPLSPVQHVHLMQAIIQRLQEESQLFMDLRHERLVQKEKESAIAAESAKDAAERKNQFMSSDEFFADPVPVEHDADEDPSEPTDGQPSSAAESESESLLDSIEVEIRDTKKDFAPPGATTGCYDTLFDAMAVATIDSPDAISWSPDDLLAVLEQLIAAHELDGGDRTNTNVYTVPTMQSYNGALRTMAAMPLHHSNNERLRDQALKNSFGIFNALTHSDSDRLKRNAATYSYMLKIISQALPPCRSRGNISISMWMQASKFGLVDRTLIQQFHTANTPSNGEEFGEFIEARQNYLDLPTRWIRYAKQRRHGEHY